MSNTVRPAGDTAQEKRQTSTRSHHHSSPRRKPTRRRKTILWRLLSNRLVETLEQASEMIDWYRRSRLIEIFFGFLKAAAVSQSTL